MSSTPIIEIKVIAEDFDAGAEIKALSSKGGGAVASFIGQVRGDGQVQGDGEVSALELEHYPAMTQKSLLAIAKTATEKWSLLGITIIHRVGRLAVGEQIVLVCTSSDHRGAAFESCAYIMDRLKTDAPFWKKEHGTDGAQIWVEERQSDVEAADRWQK